MLNRRAFLATPALGALSSCKRAPKIKVGGKVGVEGALLCEIVSQLLEHKLKAEVERRLNITGPTAVYQALQNGDVDTYVEYTRVAFKVLLKSVEPLDLIMTVDKLKKEFQTNAQAAWFPFLGFETIHTVIARADNIAFAKINTLTEAGHDRTGWKLGCTSEFAQSDEGYQMLKSGYQIPERTGTRIEPIPQLYFGLGEKRIDMLVTASTDPRLKNSKYKVLADDQKLFSPNRAALLYREDTDKRFPTVRPVLESLSGKIDNNTMRDLNGEIEINKRGLAEVALEWLTKVKLI